MHVASRKIQLGRYWFTCASYKLQLHASCCSCSVTYCCCASLQCRFAEARQTVFDAVRNKAQDECSKPVRKVAGKRGVRHCLMAAPAHTPNLVTL